MLHMLPMTFQLDFPELVVQQCHTMIDAGATANLSYPVKAPCDIHAPKI